MRKILYTGIFILLITAVLYLKPDSYKKTIEISDGMIASDIAAELADNNIIKHPGVFSFFLRLSGKAKDLKAGVYLLNTKSNYFTLINMLTKGSNIFIKVTVPEGFTVEQIGVRLQNLDVIDNAEEFTNRVIEKDLRGFLFPETYNFSPGESVDKIIGSMKRQFYEVFNDEYKERSEELGYTIKEIITLASLIEKEAKVPRERPVISAIFHKRLRKRIYLESCASVLFALGEHKRRLRYKDLDIDSPYNTYRIFGLPPTPICNPGSASIYAALYPADTEYLYFFSRGDGSHIFSKTYKEHLRLQKYRKTQP